MLCVGIQKPGGGAKLKYKILRLNDMQDVPKAGGWGKSMCVKIICRMFQKPEG